MEIWSHTPTHKEKRDTKALALEELVKNLFKKKYRVNSPTWRINCLINECHYQVITDNGRPEAIRK